MDHLRFSFDCVFYYVTDIDRALSFYQQVLGLKLTSKDNVARFDIDGVLFELVPACDGKTRGDQGNARLCLKVDAIQEAILYLQTQGVPVSEVQEKTNGALASFTDPDGNEICMWQYR